MAFDFRPPPYYKEVITTMNGSTKMDPEWANWFVQLRQVLSDLGALSYTGTGATVRQVSPTLTTPVIGAATGTSLALTGDITTGTGTLHKTSAALTNGAAANVGTLNNSPAAGNPTKWIPINDNGTVRYIPAW